MIITKLRPSDHRADTATQAIDRRIFAENGMFAKFLMQTRTMTKRIAWIAATTIFFAFLALWATFLVLISSDDWR